MSDWWSALGTIDVRVAALVVTTSIATSAALATEGLCRPPTRRPTSTDDTNDAAVGTAGRDAGQVAASRPSVTHRFRRRRPPASADDVAHWCDDLARQCRGGASVTTALTGTAPPSDPLRAVVGDIEHRTRRGAPLHVAIASAGRTDDPHLRLALDVLTVLARVGGPAARPLDRLAATLRLRSADQLDRAAQSAQARMSARVLTVVPLAALALLCALDPAVRSIVVSPIGAVLVGLGSALSCLGWWWATRIIDGQQHRWTDGDESHTTADAGRTVAGADMPARVGRVAAGASIAVLVLLLAGPAAVAIAVAIAVAVPRLRTITAARRTARRRVSAVPDATELLVLLVESGRSPREAVADLAASGPRPLRPAFGAVGARCDRGDDFATALRALDTAVGPPAAPLVDTIATTERYGTPLAAALDVLIGEARIQRRRLAEADARRLPVRLAFPLVVCTLPAFALLGIAPALLAALGSLGDLGL